MTPMLRARCVIADEGAGYVDEQNLGSFAPFSTREMWLWVRRMQPA